MSFTLSNPDALCPPPRALPRRSNPIFCRRVYIPLRIYGDEYLFRVHSKETRRTCRRCSPVERRPETN